MPSKWNMVTNAKFEKLLKIAMDDMHRQFALLFQRPIPLWLCVGLTEDELKKLILEGLHRKILHEFGTWCAFMQWKWSALDWDACIRTARRK